MLIFGIQKVTLIDYPEKIACVVFTHGCNFRCKFCHNPELVVKKAKADQAISNEDFFKFLDERKNKLDGVVITGGEPLLNLDLIDFVKEIKQKGFSVKIDTNGSFPDRLEKLLDENLVDYVAMDVKTGLEKYCELTSWDDVQKIVESISLIRKRAPEYEFRTTLVKGLHTKEDVLDIAKLVRGARKFVLQNFVSGNSISKDLSQKNEFSTAELEAFAKIFKEYVKHVDIRNVY